MDISRAVGGAQVVEHPSSVIHGPRWTSRYTTEMGLSWVIGSVIAENLVWCSWLGATPAILLARDKCGHQILTKSIVFNDGLCHPVRDRLERRIVDLFVAELPMQDMLDRGTRQLELIRHARREQRVDMRAERFAQRTRCAFRRRRTGRCRAGGAGLRTGLPVELAAQYLGELVERGAGNHGDVKACQRGVGDSESISGNIPVFSDGAGLPDDERTIASTCWSTSEI